MNEEYYCHKIYTLLMKSSAYSPTPQPSSIDNSPFIWITSSFL